MITVLVSDRPGVAPKVIAACPDPSDKGLDALARIILATVDGKGGKE